jgi:hypothetical protein
MPRSGTLEKILSELRHVAQPRAQRRQAYFEHAQPLKQIFAKTLFIDCMF